MDIGQSFGYIGEDENWMVKVGLGAVVTAVPILNFAALGYQVQVIRNVTRDEKEPLPEWSDWGQFFTDGLWLFLVILVYALPLIAVYGVFFAALFITLFSATEEFNPSSLPPEMFLLLSVVVLAAVFYSIILWLLWPLIMVQYARHGLFTACFNFRQMWQLVRQNGVNYLIIIGVSFGLSMALSIVIMPSSLILGFIPCLGFLISMLLSGAVGFLQLLVLSHMQGQFIRQSHQLL